MNIAIIGGVAGGAGAAAAARRANESATIHLFEAGPHISFANCGLPYFLSGEIAQREKLLVTSPDTMAQRFDVNVHTRHEVTEIDRPHKTLRVKNLATGEQFNHLYDRLVIATGTRSIRPPTPGLDHPRVAECRTVADVDRLSDLIQRYKNGRALVIGAGFIGVEVTEALTLRGLRVTQLDLAPQILPPLDPEIAAAAQGELQRHNITLKLAAKVEHITHNDHDSRATLSTGETVDFDFAVLSIGVTPETSLAATAGLAVGPTGGLVVDAYQRTSDPNIFAAGDVTELLYWPTETRMKLALAGPANKQARVAGANAALPEPRFTASGAAGTSIVRVFGLAFGMTGLSEKAAAARKIPSNIVYTQNNHHAGYFPAAEPLFIKIVFASSDGRVLGGQIFGRQDAGVDKRLDVLATAIQAKFTVDQLADLDLAYAPPFGSAKDPLIIAGMVASNVFHGRTRIITPRDLAAELALTIPPLVLDVRTEKEHALAKIEGALNIPIDNLRKRLSDLPRDRPIVTHCAVGYRGYLAERILLQSGHSNVRNLTGGLRAWQLLQKSRTN